MTRLLPLVLILLVPTIHAEAQTVPEDLRPTLKAVALEQAPRLDGRVSDDPVWSQVPASAEFWQTQPEAGRPASERTEVRVAFTRDTLYVAAVLFDREPGRVITSDSRRDGSLDDTDSFRFIIDTYQDGQNGFVFGTSPAGIEYDAQVSREGQGGFGNGRQRGGSGAGFNINWDASWVVRTHTGDYGWSAEFAIPFKTLRFPRSDLQTWGFNAQRNLRRRNERAFWAPLPRSWDLYRVSRAGSLEGISVPDVRNFKVTPFTVASAYRDNTVVDPETDSSIDFGVDVKYGITPSLTLDATYNTDFAQVEVDEQQVNLDRFSLFFPEKRPFFLENAGLFSVGESSEVELFFSRRIGIENGIQVPIVGGLRLSGQAGETRIGLLSMQTGTDDGRFVANNYSVIRAQRELPNRSALGFLATSRQGMGGAAPSNDFNRLVSLDGRLGIGRFGTLEGFAAHTMSPGQDPEAWSVNGEIGYNDGAWRLSASFTQVGEDFKPELGFLRRTAYRKTSLLAFRAIRMEGRLGLYEIRPHVNFRNFWGLDGFHETGYLHVDNHWEWPGGYEIHTGVNFTREGVREAFEIQEGYAVPAGTYDHREAMLVAFTDQSKWISIYITNTMGGFFGGDRVSFLPTLRLRSGESLSTEFGVSYNRIDLPSGAFTTNLYRARVSYAFTPRIYVQGLVQYSDQAEVWSSNVRFGWLQDANTGLFIVLNQTNSLDAALDGTLNRGVTVKYSRQFDR